jgi:carbonic anhydrase
MCNSHHQTETRLGIRQIGRRSFLTLATAASGATLLFSAAPARAASKAEALLLSCIDYRLVNDTHNFMDGLGMTDKYDHLVIAGASVGVLHEGFAAWHETFWTHLEVAIALHGIHKVIVLDHRDCGAYKIAHGAEHAADPAAEFTLHTEQMNKLAAMVKERRPELEFEGFLMALDGSVEKLDVNV